MKNWNFSKKKLQNIGSNGPPDHQSYVYLVEYMHEVFANLD